MVASSSVLRCPRHARRRPCPIRTSSTARSLARSLVSRALDAVATVGGMAVPLMDPHSQYAAVRAQVTRAIGEVIDSGRFILGPRVAEAERVFAEQVGTSFGIGVANGTDALLIALRALGVRAGRRGHLPVVHVLRHRRVDRRRGRGARLRRHRGRDVLPRSGSRRGSDHPQDARRHARAPVRPSGCDGPRSERSAPSTISRCSRTRRRPTAPPSTASAAAPSGTQRPSRSSRPRICRASATAA